MLDKRFKRMLDSNDDATGVRRATVDTRANAPSRSDLPNMKSSVLSFFPLGVRVGAGADDSAAMVSMR